MARFNRFFPSAAGATRVRRMALVFGLLVAYSGQARSVFVNGVDVSSSRNQKLSNVVVAIDENGDVLITAPHYRVIEEDTYSPLGSYSKDLNASRHKGRTALPPTLSKVGPAAAAEPLATTQVDPGTPATVTTPASKTSDDAVPDTADGAEEAAPPASPLLDSKTRGGQIAKGAKKSPPTVEAAPAPSAPKAEAPAASGGEPVK